MTHFLFDLRVALRVLWRDKGFSLGVFALITLGVSLTTILFSVVESRLFLPPNSPHPRAEALFVSTRPVSREEVRALRQHATHADAIAGRVPDGRSLTLPGRKPVYVRTNAVSAEFFSLLGVHAQRGRLFRDEDPEDVIVVSPRLWARIFESDPDLVGKHLELDGRRHRVIGLASIDVAFTMNDVWLPLRPAHDGDPRLVVRRRVDASDPQVLDEFAARSVELLPLHPPPNRETRAFLWIAFAAVACVHAIVCANVASLFLARAFTRRAAMAVRAALGADRLHVARPFLLEATLLFLAGGVAAALAARWFVHVFPWGTFASLPVVFDATTLLYCVLVCSVSAAAAGAAPFLVMSAPSPHAALKDTAAQAGGRTPQARVRKALAALQIAFAFGLLVAARLVAEGVQSDVRTGMGFNAQRLFVTLLSRPENGGASKLDPEAFARSAIEAVTATQGVDSAAATSRLPFVESNDAFGNFPLASSNPPRRSVSITVRPSGIEPKLHDAEELPLGVSLDPSVADRWVVASSSGVPMAAESIAITPGYFLTMGIPLLGGRDFTHDDRAGGPPVAIVSQTVAARAFPGADAIGKPIVLDDGEPRTIVGVCGDVEGSRRELVPLIHLPLAQAPSRALTLVVRTTNSLVLLPRVADAVASVDPQQAVTTTVPAVSLLTMDSVLRGATLLLPMSTFAMVALFLASLGVFALVSYQTRQRSREFAIRIALGASRARVIGLVLWDTARVLAAGLLLGALTGLATALGLEAHVPGITGLDPGALAAPAAYLTIAAIVAVLLPTWRAVRVPPAIALRND